MTTTGPIILLKKKLTVYDKPLNMSTFLKNIQNNWITEDSSELLFYSVGKNKKKKNDSIMENYKRSF